MENIRIIFLVGHIVSGYSALMIGTYLLVKRKGNTHHKSVGNWFYWLMQSVSYTALPLSLIIESQFLFHVGVFVFHLNTTGKILLHVHHKKLNVFFLLLGSLCFLNAAVMMLTLNPVLMVFGGLSMLFTLQDFWVFFSPKIRNYKFALRQHIGRMMGSFIGAFTAFLVVNVTLEKGWILWFLPTFVLVPLIIFWTRKYTRHLNPKLS